MRKLIVGLVVVGLLAVGAPAMAQRSDPLGLISSGAVLPYVGNGTIAPGSISFLEVASPVEDNSGLHMFFFDTSCKRQGQSVGLPLTTNDVEILRVDDLGGGTPNEGLLTMAQIDAGGFALKPLPVNSPIHARVLWLNAAGDYIRILEPIGLLNFDVDNDESWNPLRTGATFWAPPVIPGFLNTTVYFICPSTGITGGASSAFPTVKGFPELIPAANDATQLRFRIFDDEENFLRDVKKACSCLTKYAVTDISDVYAKLGPGGAPNGTYTEIEGDTVTAAAAQCSVNPADPQTCPGDPTKDCFVVSTGCNLTVIKPSTKAGGPFSFTGYRAVSVTLGEQGLDAFGRLSNGAACSINDFATGCEHNFR